MYCALCDTVIVHNKTNKRTGFANRRAIVQTKDTLGTGLLSFVRRLSLSRWFMIIQSILIELSLFNKLVNA